MAKKALIIYGTTSGNTEYVVERIQEGLQDRGMQVTLERVEVAQPEDAKNYDLLILACPTYNVGRLQEYFEPFYEKLVKADLKDLPAAVVALGMSKDYDIYAEAADYLETGLQKAGAKQILPTLRIDGMPHGRDEEWQGFGHHLADTFFQNYS